MFKIFIKQLSFVISLYGHKGLPNVYQNHISVMLSETLDLLFGAREYYNPEEIHYFADLTFGGGGHSLAILNRCPHTRVIAVDQDPDAIQNGKQLIKGLPLDKEITERIQLNWINFVDFPKFIKENQIEILERFTGFKGILLDLGVSSHQFDMASRGFSFREEGPLDMRMNSKSDQIPTARELVNNLSAEELTKIISEWGEDRYAWRIANAITEKRKSGPIESTSELENIVFHAYPKSEREKSKARNSKYNKSGSSIHPATRTFQALRIAVNNELNILSKVLPDLWELLAPGGRLICISFHSLEDRIVKNSFKSILANNQGKCSIITKKPIVPSESEIKINSRARSAKLRCIEKQFIMEDELNDRSKWNIKRGRPKS